MSNTINRLVLAITSKETLETLERWQFDIIREDDDSTTVTSSTVPQGSTINGVKPGGKGKEKTEKEVQGEIREIMKQITASVTFLPTLEEECRFAFLLSSLLITDIYLHVFPPDDLHVLRLIHPPRIHINIRSSPPSRKMERRRPTPDREGESRASEVEEFQHERAQDGGESLSVVVFRVAC